MQESFEFNAPRTYNFIALPKCRQPNDYSINLADPNDYWFMVTHVQVSPTKISDHDSLQDLENQPVRRMQVHQKQPEAQVQPAIVLNQPQVKKRKTTRKTLAPKPIIKPSVGQNKDRKTTAILDQRLNKWTKQFLAREKILEAKNDLAKVQKPTVNFMEAKQSYARTKSVGFISKSRKDEIKFSRPCPFPPRIQRQWEKGSKKDWHSLSPQSKLEAQKKMGQIKQSKDLKGIPQKKKEKKEQGRFKF